MYDVHGKSVGGDSKGRMQQAVDDWEKSAENAAGLHEKHNEDDFDAEIKDIIKNNVGQIKVGKEQTAEKQTEVTSHSEEPVPPLPSHNENESASRFVNDSIARSLESSDEPDGQLDESFTECDVGNHDDVTDDEPGDYESSEQAQEILSDQNSLQSSLATKFAGCIVCTLILAFLAAAPVLNIQLPSIINISSHPACYIVANLILLLIAGFLGFSVAFKGIANLFTFTADTDGLISLSFYAAMIGGAYTLYNYAVCKTPATGLHATAIFSSCAVAALSFNLLSKVLLIARVKNNLKFISEPENERSGFYAAMSVEPSRARGLMRTFNGTPSVVTTVKTKFLTSYLEQSYVETPSDRVSRVLAPIVLVVALLSAGCELLVKKDVAGAFTVFTAVCCIASPLLLEMGVALPFYRACKKLVQQQALVTGCATVSKFGGTDALVADGNLIFPGNATRIFGVKTFHSHTIDEAVLYASSIACEGKSPLASALTGIYSDVGLGKNLLRTVEKIVYEDEKGLSAIIDDKVVLFGNRGLLRHHIIEAPSRDYELRYAINGEDVAYLAIGGEICAMFIVEYGISANTSVAIRKLHRYGVRLLIESSDSNITPLLLEEKCGLSANSADMLGAREMQMLEVGKSDGTCPAGLAFKDMAGYVSAVVSCIKLKGSLWANTLLQVAFSAVGMLLVGYCAFFAGGATTISPAFVLVYQVLCAVPVLLISLFRRD